MSVSAQYPRRYLITAEEYLRMGAAGIFTAEARLELMDGEVVEMAPIGSEHAAVVNRLNRLMVLASAGRAIISTQNPVVVGTHSVPQPDLLLLKPRPDEYFTAHPRVEDVLLVVEVADSSLRFDLERKVPAYGRAGIAEAWVVDLKARMLRVFTGPTPDVGYTSNQVIAGDQKVSPAALPDVRIGLADLFPS